jgi:hypothetical protein
MAEESKMRKVPKGKFKEVLQSRKYLLPELIPLLNVVFKERKKKYLRVTVNDMKIIFAIAALDTLEGCATYDRICDVLGEKVSKLKINALRKKEFVDVYNPDHPRNYRYKPGRLSGSLFSSYSQSIALEVVRLEELGIFLKYL